MIALSRLHHLLGLITITCVFALELAENSSRFLDSILSYCYKSFNQLANTFEFVSFLIFFFYVCAYPPLKPLMKMVLVLVLLGFRSSSKGLGVVCITLLILHVCGSCLLISFNTQLLASLISSCWEKKRGVGCKCNFRGLVVSFSTNHVSSCNTSFVTRDLGSFVVVMATF